ncbi:MAG TPA: alkaline phosphatase [Thermodesulfovibrio thiophilus]|nr:alkaline phosphatase [Thermodesulfovibrio thiophilus]HQD37227.1 alkaline phosphatase [Thermodesulfovibrio thiophilus]
MDRRAFLKSSVIGLLAFATTPQNILANSGSFESKNAQGIIFLVGDGWPLGVLKGMNEFSKRIFKEESNLVHLINHSMSMVLLQNTSSLSSVVTDSAPASVAWATGSKTVNRSLSVLPNGRKLKTIFELAQQESLSCGFVTTTRVTHATPAAWYSHNSNRDDEDTIAIDLLNAKLDVVMGGGSKHFVSSQRKDNRELFEDFKNAGYTVVKSRDELLNVSYKKSILGIFSNSHIDYFIDRINNIEIASKQPALYEMTAVALKKLSQNPRGFILQVEAGRIDHACHANDAFGAIMDCYEMDKTVGVILEFMRKNQKVLLIVTSDHGNSGFGINGTGPEYNDTTGSLLSYRNSASFEYMIKKMKNKDVSNVKEIFEHYTQQKITQEEAEEIWQKLNEQREFIVNDIWYEPEATMGRILRSSKYNSRGDSPAKPALLRRGNVGFTSTNHTAEDQLVIIFGGDYSELKIKKYLDNTDLYSIMTKYLNITYYNPKMTEEEAKPFIKTISRKEWEEHLKLHIG